MKNNKKKSSTAKKLMPAFAMLTVSAMTLASSTYAWFSMNTAVTATGMKVTAQAESGIVISSSSAANSVWSASASTSESEKSLYPTSTNDCSTWYHNSSKAFDVATGAEYVGTYETLAANALTNYVSEHTFYIKSSSNTALEKGLQITNVTITPPTNSSSANLNNSIRVAVKYSTAAPSIFRMSGGTQNYQVNGNTSTTATAAGDGLSIAVPGISSIPKSTDTPIQIKVYIWFEGEDANCKSSNVTASLDQLQVSLQFTAVDPPAVGN